MSLKEFELFHGAFLTQLVRREKPITLRLIETDTSQSWSVYKVNDVSFFLKHSTNPKSLEKGGKSWRFPFTENQLEQVREDTCIVLVCGSKDTKDKEMEVCLIESKNVKNLLSKNAKNLTVHIEPRKKIRVSSSAVDKKISISRNALKNYKIPS